MSLISFKNNAWVTQVYYNQERMATLSKHMTDVKNYKDGYLCSGPYTNTMKCMRDWYLNQSSSIFKNHILNLCDTSKLFSLQMSKRITVDNIL